jgi:hypothetical protein
MPPTEQEQSRSLNLKHAPSPDGVFHDAPIDLAVSPDEAYVYITNLHSLAVLDIAANVVKSTSVGVLPRATRLSADGSGRMYSISISKPFGRLTPPTTQLSVLLTSVGIRKRRRSGRWRFLYVTDYLDGTASVIPTAPLKPKAEGR